MKSNNNPRPASLTPETLHTLRELRCALADTLCDVRDANDHDAPVYLNGCQHDGRGAAHAIAAAIAALDVLGGYAYGNDLRYLSNMARIAHRRLSDFENRTDAMQRGDY